MNTMTTKQARSLFTVTRVAANCTRCGGSGYFRPYGACFGCSGTGKRGTQRGRTFNADVTAEQRREAIRVDEQALRDQREKAAERRDAKRQRERAANFERVCATCTHLAEAFATANDDNSFVNDIRNKVKQYGNISDRQAAAVIKSAERDRERAAKREQWKAEAAAATPIPTSALDSRGRMHIAGEIIATKTVENSGYGCSYKMMVRDDRGFKIWSSVPSSIDAQRGMRISFDAAVTISDNDAAFGFAKRPTKVVEL
jgi:hypothetical protein